MTGTGRTAAGGSGCELAAGSAAPVPLLTIVVVADGAALGIAAETAGTAADTAGTAADTAGTAAFAAGTDVAVAPPPLASPTLATVASLPASFPFTALPVALAPNILAHDSGPTTYKQANAQVRALYVLTLHEKRPRCNCRHRPLVPLPWLTGFSVVSLLSTKFS